MNIRTVVGAAVILLGCIVGASAQSTINNELQAVVEAMGKTLTSPAFSFHNRTIREFTDETGQPLHVFHSETILVRRPDRLLVTRIGDDGTTIFGYDGKNLVIYAVDEKQYATMPVTGNSSIEQVMAATTERLRVDFPMADFVADSPAKAFLSGVTSGVEVASVLVDGVFCRHFLFNQPPGIEVELWTENTEQATPRRLVVTYRSIPGEPRFIAEMSDWKFNLKPSDSAFVINPPTGTTKVELPDAPK